MSEEIKKTSFLKKFFKWIIGIVIALVVIVAGGIYYALNYLDWQSIVRNLVHEQGSAAVGTSVNIGNIDLSLSDGKGKVSDISVANPKGYSQKYIMRLDGISVAVDVNSIKKIAEETVKGTGSKVKTVVINEIRIDKPEVAYELMSLQQNNVNDILANIKKNTASASNNGKSAEKTKADANATQYNVAIKKVIVANGVATVAANMLGSSQSLSLNLPTVTISNLGTEKQGITIEDGIAKIFQEILKTTTNVVAKANLSSVLNGVTDVANQAVNGATQAAGAVVNQAGETANAVVGGAANAAGSAVDSVSDTTKGIANSVGGLFQ